MGMLDALQRAIARFKPVESDARPLEEVEPIRVLVVDDDPEVLDTAERLLMAANYLPISTGTPQAALQIARSMRPDVVLLDVLMPGFDGWDVLAALKADPTTGDIPVVMISMLGERDRALAAGAHDVVTKPLDEAKLRAALDGLPVARAAGSAQSSSR